MGLLNRLFGFRWSLYVVINGNQLVYVMHENSVMGMLGYLRGYRCFADGAKPVEPWSLYLNFNHKHQTIKLEPEHFTPDGNDITPTLIHQIESIDPGCWQVKSVEPVFEEAATKKRIKITTGHTPVEMILSRFANAGKPHELTFFQVMDVVFGKS